MGKMKANRKFIKEEKAVSAVIGVILMVAITVAIAATVYVYVSGMLPTGKGAIPSITLQQNGAVGTAWALPAVNFSIISASADAKWSDLKVQVGTVDYGIPATTAIKSTSVPPYGCSYLGSGTPIKAGGTIVIHGTTTTVTAGLELKLIHTASNSVIATATLY